VAAQYLRPIPWLLGVNVECASLGVVMLSAVALAQNATPRLHVEFTASAPQFAADTKAYQDLWAGEGARIVEAMERRTSLRFEAGPIRAVVYEGVSYSGYRERPMQMRASYPPDTKKATLVHELGHRLMGDLVPPKIEHHSIIFLFVYDVWVELYGQAFADQQLAVERRRTGQVDYDGLWNQALKLSAAERASRFEQFVRENRK
jgi:hypothetical protein